VAASQNYLGIYISKGTAAVVCLGSQGKDGNVLGRFSVSAEGQEHPDGMSALASLITQGCAEKGLKFSEVAVALDCAMFMQHSVHSEFNDPKQIAATVRFDTEEALATDISDVALAFEIHSSSESGSELTVFTAQRKILSDVLYALQQHNLDPITIEPDVNCLSRFIRQKVSSTESAKVRTLFAMLSRRSGYLIVPPIPAGGGHDVAPRGRAAGGGRDSTQRSGVAGAGSQKASTVRTFLVGPTQNRGELLAREVLVTAALTASVGSINRVKAFDSTGSVDYEQLGEKVGIEADGIDWLGAAGIETQRPTADGESVDLAVAYGAALAHFERGAGVNFRDDFSPFQGKKLKLQESLKYLSISVTVLLLAIGLYFQIIRVFRVNGFRSDLRDRFAKAYSAAMPGQKLSDKDKIRDGVRKLSSLLRRIESEKKGLITDEQAVSSKLTLVLDAFNKCAAQTNLNIKSISVTARDIGITGDTSNRRNTLAFFDTVRNSGLEISKEAFAPKGARDTFTITVVPKK